MSGETCSVKVINKLKIMKNSFFKWILLTTFFIGNMVPAQQTVDTDQMLKDAIEARNSGEFRKALTLSEEALKYAPDYLDFRILAGSIYNRLQEPDKAIAQYEMAVNAPAYSKDAQTGLGIAYEIKKDPQTALKIYQKLMGDYPREPVFYKKAIGLSEELNEQENALKYAENWVKNIPEDKEAHTVLENQKKILSRSQQSLLLNNNISSTEKQNRIGILYMPSFMKNSSFHILSLEYLRRSDDKKNTLIARINYGNRNSSGGVQFEAEDYWVHGKKNYSFFNAAVSPDPIFPDFRAGYSLFSGLDKGWELETGARYIRAAGEDTYTLVLGGSKEFENNWLNLKNYLTLNNQRYYPSHVLTWRHFLNDHRDYVSLILGLGISPELQNNQYSFNGYKDKSLGAGYQRKLGAHYLFSLTSVYNRLFFGNDIFKNRFDFYANLYYQF